MGPVLLVFRVLLACLFFVAGVAKLADLAGSRRAVVGFGVPDRLVGVGLPVCELAVAVALIPAGSARFGALGALVLLAVFMAAISVALARGTRADCHCVGQLHSAPVGWRTLVRNGMLAAAAGFVAQGEELATLGVGLSGGGLPVGSRAPEFTLPSVEGEPRSLGSLLSAGLPLLLVFSDAGCGPCDALLPELADWQKEHSARLGVALIASGDEQANRDKAERHRLELVLLQTGHGVSNAYQARGTPMALVINADGLIASPTVGGADAIRMLLAQATRPVLAVRQVPSSTGQRNGAGPSAPLSDASRVGQPAPALALSDLDGHAVELQDFYAQRTLAIFWNPGCGFCQRMLPAMRRRVRDQRRSA